MTAPPSSLGPMRQPKPPSPALKRAPRAHAELGRAEWRCREDGCIASGQASDQLEALSLWQGHYLREHYRARREQLVT